MRQRRGAFNNNQRKKKGTDVSYIKEVKGVEKSAKETQRVPFDNNKKRGLIEKSFTLELQPNYTSRKCVNL